MVQQSRKKLAVVVAIVISYFLCLEVPIWYESIQLKYTESISLYSIKKVQLEENQERKSHVKQMMKHAWTNYRLKAWGYDYLNPISGKGTNLYSQTLCLSLIDSLSTLKVMELNEEFEESTAYIKSLNVSSFYTINEGVSFHTATTHLIGGLLSAYELSKNDVFKKHAIALGNRLLPAFDTPMGFPDPIISLKTGEHKSYKGSTSNLAEMGTNILEFTRLSQVSKNDNFEVEARGSLNTFDILIGPTLTIPGFYPTVYFMQSGELQEDPPRFSVGNGAASFYEYLLKMYIMSKKTDTQAARMFDTSISSIRDHLYYVNPEGLNYFASGALLNLDTQMSHLACKTGGLFALSILGGKSTDVARDTKIATGIAKTCFEMYYRQSNGLAPDAVNMDIPTLEAAHSDASYTHKSEVVECLFYMWRLTHDLKYREMAWKITQAIELYTKVKYGYSGLKSINYVVQLSPSSFSYEFDDVQQSHLMSSTLKYLYLIFSDDDVLPLSEWVFNTNGHPLKMQ